MSADIITVEGVSISALSEKTGVDRRTIKKRLSAVGVEPVGTGTFGPLYDEALAVEAIGTKQGRRPADLLESEARIAAARAIQEEAEADKIQGSVIEVDVVAKAWEAIISNIRQKVLAMPTKVESQYRENMTAQAVRVLVEAEVDELLTELSRDVDYAEPGGTQEAYSENP